MEKFIDFITMSEHSEKKKRFVIPIFFVILAVLVSVVAIILEETGNAFQTMLSVISAIIILVILWIFACGIRYFIAYELPDFIKEFINFFKNRRCETSDVEVLEDVENSDKADDSEDLETEIIEEQPLETPEEEDSDKVQDVVEELPQKTFIDYLHHENKDALMDKLHLLIDGAQSKDVAITIKALERIGFLGNYGTRKHLYELIREEFDFKGSDSGLNDFLKENSNKISEDDIKRNCVILENIPKFPKPIE
jgi:hypothetical protein